MRLAIALVLAGCATPQVQVPANDCLRVANARAPGGSALELIVDDGQVASGACPNDFDAEGRFVVPSFIDSHVHLAYLPVHEELVQNGVAGAVDLAAPIDFIARDHSPLRIVHAGPMIVAPGGYPTQSWGSGGYGLECDGAEACASAVDRVVEAGARVIKVSLGMGPDHDDATMRAIVARAHERRMPVLVHALDDASAFHARELGADVLAHTPVEPLGDRTVAAWSDGVVISTLAAFGGTDETVQNLRRLRDAGAEVFYGTDLGNTRTPGIDEREIMLLASAGLDGAAIVRSATADPAAFFGIDDLGSLETGRAASFILVDADPLEDPTTLAHPAHVFVDGALVR